MKRFWMICMMAVVALGIVFRSVYAEEASEKQEKYSYMPNGYGDGEEQDPTLPDSVDYQNLTEEQKALLEENEKNALTEEKIAQMSARELWEYQLIPLEGVGDGVFSSYPVSYYGMPELYPFQTEGVPYYGRCSSQHYVIGYELYQEPGTREERIAVLENPAQAGQEKRYYENYVVLREKIASVHDGF